MASKNPKSMYPEVLQSNPETNSSFNSSNYPYHHQSSSSMYPPPIDSSSSTSVQSKISKPSSLYPSLDMKDLVENLFPDKYDEIIENPNSSSYAPSAPIESVEEILVKIPGAILHLIDKQYSVELSCGDLSIVRLRQGDNVVAVLARVADEIQWPLAKDEASVKLDDSHYFFSLRFPAEEAGSSDDEEHGHSGNGKGNDHELLNYGLTIASKGQESLLREFDKILEHYSSFSVQKVMEKKSEALDVSVENKVSPAEMKSEKKKEIMEERSTAYWTTLAPNVEEYSGGVAKAIAAGSGQLIKGILWCGDVTVERLKWGDEILRKRMDPCKKDAEVSPETLKRIKRVKKMSKMSEKVATGVLSGVLKVSGYFTSSVVNSKAGKKFFNLLPGEVVLASMDGFGKVCDAVEVAGRNVMSTTSVVTTGLVSHRHGEKAAEATHEGLDAAGHAAGTAFAVFKIRKALNPKGVIKPSTLAKSAAKAAAKSAAKQKK
ncbi:Senescence/dehydration-associated protein [Thalictrum thalictroides]|uniref:Senescence/dehydration-associated protein n=1 Tax=Thalictrum thalictroides TaxID=46969 RepID=A0A7J6VTL9_THATH|nr:Senescence/dehydration-associated protein [Thalictrum thalictroides]